jgi:hypothetical protein
MVSKKLSHSLVLSALLTLSACGGSSALDLEAAAAAFSTKFNSALASLTSSVGLNSQALTNLFDDKFLDGGSNKSQLLNMVTESSTALATSPDLSLFPMAAVTNVKLTGCDSNYVCTLNGTLTNSDADTTTVDFSTKVIVIAGVVYLYGDQSLTTSI